jgi:hypothetical protein
MGHGVHDFVCLQLLAEQLLFPSSLPIEAQMAFARNTRSSRSGDPDDPFESMALELESDNFHQRNLEKHLDVDHGCNAEDANAANAANNNNDKRGSKGAERRKRKPGSPKEDSLWWHEWLTPAKAQRLRTADETTDSKAKDFQAHLCMPFKTFKDLANLAVRKGVCDQSKKDAVGRPCKNVGSLTLSCPHPHSGHGCPFGCIKRCVKIGTSQNASVSRALQKSWRKSKVSTKRLAAQGVLDRLMP